MRVNLIKQQTVMNYAYKHAESLSSCKRLIHTIKAADWDKPEDMIKTFGSNNVDHLKGTQKLLLILVEIIIGLYVSIDLVKVVSVVYTLAWHTCRV